jgi:hypothetical protein
MASTPPCLARSISNWSPRMQMLMFGRGTEGSLTVPEKPGVRSVRCRPWCFDSFRSTYACHAGGHSSSGRSGAFAVVSWCSPGRFGGRLTRRSPGSCASWSHCCSRAAQQRSGAHRLGNCQFWRREGVDGGEYIPTVILDILSVFQ